MQNQNYVGGNAQDRRRFRREQQELMLAGWFTKVDARFFHAVLDGDEILTKPVSPEVDDQLAQLRVDRQRFLADQAQWERDKARALFAFRRNAEQQDETNALARAVTDESVKLTRRQRFLNWLTSNHQPAMA